MSAMNGEGEDIGWWRRWKGRGRDGGVGGGGGETGNVAVERICLTIISGAIQDYLIPNLLHSGTKLHFVHCTYNNVHCTNENVHQMVD